MENKIYLNGKRPLTLLEELCVPEVTSNPLALRNNDSSKKEQKVFRRVPVDDFDRPVINIYNFYFGDSKESSSASPVAVSRGLVGDFPEPILLETDPLQSLLAGYHPLLRKLREEGISSREYSRAVELVGAILAEPWLGAQYIAEAALVEWSNGLETDILGIYNNQPNERERMMDLKLGRLNFSASRPSQAGSYKDPNITFYGRNGRKIELNQVQGVPTFYVKNCLVKFLR